MIKYKPLILASKEKSIPLVIKEKSISLVSFFDFELT